MTQAQGRVTAYVLFVKPPDFAAGWEQTDLLTSAATIPGVTVVRDDDGIEASRFRAATSGQTVLYDADGKLLFSGGITGARGHAGDNAGRAAVVSLLAEDETERQETPVYGCPLFDRGNKCPKGKEGAHETDKH
jgi:glyoxylase-like metal-dependent hydrolase (beta-lactamase superfamily II)